MSDALKTPFLALEDGTVWPNPADPKEVEWHLRYDRENGTPMDRSTELLAASYIEAFRNFFWTSGKRRARVVRMLRKKMGLKR